jgi:hypothetical protein
MRCSICHQWIKYGNGELPTSFAAHLEECADCLELLIDRYLAESIPPQVQPGFASRVLSAIPSRRPHNVMYIHLSWVACSMLATLVCLWTSLHAGQNSSLIWRTGLLPLAVGLELTFLFGWLTRSTVV